MAEKKNTKPKNVEAPAEAEQELSAAEEEREAILAEEDLLADVPALRSPERLRLRHKNRILAIGFRFRDKLDELGIDSKDGRASISTEHALLMMDVAADIDEFAESIAEDSDEYERWAEANSDKPEVFIALMNRYTAAVGE